MNWNWISVEDRLPEEGVQVLVATRENAYGHRLIFNAWLQSEQGGYPIDWMMFCQIALRPKKPEGEITHWILFSPPPAEE